VDVSFKSGDKTRRIRGLRRFGMLPSERNPLVMFLGVDSSAENAVFLVDSSLKSEGEGSCKSSGSGCALLSLGAGSEERFTAEDGASYTLTIDEIRRVKVSRKKARASAHRRGRAAAERKASRRRVRRFMPPVLLDLVTVARPLKAGSSATAGSR
jgi:hypothetical protein